MSMNFSEFKHKLGAEPHSREPEFLRARHSAPEFEQAAAEAEHFEEKLERAVALPVPEGLIDELRAVSLSEPSPRRRRWLPVALAASVLVAVGAASLYWNMSHSWASVDAYLADHYQDDGQKLIAMADGSVSADSQSFFSRFDVRAEPALAGLIGVIKYCPTPDGKGVHMVLNTQNGPVTLIYMPEIHVNDGQVLGFDRLEAMLVDLPRGSAAIIGTPDQEIRGLYAMVHDSIIPGATRS
jgi:hypothetical protein